MVLKITVLYFFMQGALLKDPKGIFNSTNRKCAVGKTKSVFSKYRGNIETEINHQSIYQRGDST